MHLVLKGKAAGKAVVVAGCVPQADRHLKGLEDVSMVGIQQVDRVVEVVEETLKGHTVRLLAKNRLPELDLPKIRKNPMVEIIPLSTGCLGACTYCKTRHARGKLGSYTPEAIVARAQSVIAEGVTEIWLSSEDTGAYGIDIGTDLPTLLNALVNVVPDGVMLRVGMTNPPYILQHLDAVAKVLNHDSVYSFLHVPVQSGSDAVLLAMNREYTVADFEQVADVLLDKVPRLTLATDIICGFPGETEADFDGTMALVDKYKFHIMNISQFYPRPGTPAAKMRRIPTQVVKNRSRRLTHQFEVLAPYTPLVGLEVKVWVNTEISDDQKFTVAHTKNYSKVLLPRDDSLMGCTAMVKIASAARFHVNAEVISRSEPVTSAARRVRDQLIANGRQASSRQVAAPSSASAVASITGGCGAGGEECNSCDGKGETSSGCCGGGSCGNDASGEECCNGGGGCQSSPLASNKKGESEAPPSRLFQVIRSLRDDPVALVAVTTVVASTIFVASRLVSTARR
jgi:threonylcarbamoyladenosine tRNA methylthiotransferase CDKAL1